MARFIFTLVMLLTSIYSVLAQDVDAGKAVFSQCRACHQVGENAKNFVGPVLNGIIGRKSGSVENYTYSDANKSSGIVWTEETFTNYIKDPRSAIPGTKMVFVGIKDDQKIVNLIAFLKSFDAEGKPVK